LKNKLIFVIGISFVLINIPSIAVSESLYHNNFLPTIDPPDWATCYFIGVLGLTDTVGHPQKPTEFIAGYCQDDFKGQFAGVIARENEGETQPDGYEPIGYIYGRVIGSFMLGIIGNLSSGKKTGMAGIGFRNETHFYFRTMAIVGPTFYLAGKYVTIEEL
jgi:hypothetical protein